jgi:hypothetical protein
MSRTPLEIGLHIAQEGLRGNRARHKDGLSRS